ncbi:olfactory receptor 143-like [Sigmodon hispidus]
MAYDRYVAICQPLMYMVIMSPRTCSLMMFGSYLMGFVGAIVHTGCMLRLSFCDSNLINHYMCDIFPLLQLSCSSTYANELVSSVVISTVVIASSLLILMSYALILFNITQLSSGKVKEFILLGLTQQLELQLPLFFLFLGIYVVSMVGNLGLIVLIALNPHLHA